MKYSRIASGLLVGAALAASLSADVASVLKGTGAYEINGAFCQYDFADASAAFDWAYHSYEDGNVYQLQGTEATAANVFGFVEAADVTTCDAQWYMAQIEDTDEDGMETFDWIMVSPDGSAVYKLTGVTADGLFAYSPKLALDATIDMDTHTMLFGETTELHIFHMNDHHSHVAEEEMELDFNGLEIDVNMGGLARAATKINELKSMYSNSLALHAGDAFQGTVYYALFKSEADAMMMNHIDFDAFTLGNHEFDDGDEELAYFLGNLNESISIVSSNVVAPEGNILYDMWTPYVVKEIDGESYGIIGLEVVEKTKESSNPSDEIEFLPEVETTQQYVDELEEMGIDKIILLSHNGLERDLDLVSQVHGVDVVIDGDSHSLMGDFSMVGLSSSYDYPEMRTDMNGKPVCIAQAWQYSYIIGNLDVVFSETGDVALCNGTPIMPLGDEFMEDLNDTAKATVTAVIDAHDNLEIIAQDEAALATLAPYTTQVDDFANEIIGEAGEVLAHNRFPNDGRDGYNLSLGSDIAPVVSKAFYDLSNRSDACIQNAGGVRISITEGNISVGTAYTLLPFANTLYEIDMYGFEIKQVLEDAVNFAVYGGSTGAFPYAYGLKYEVDATKADQNGSISNLQIKDRESGEWSAIDMNATYVIVTNNYIAGGKDGYTTFKTVVDERGGVDTYLDYALSFVTYVKNLTEAGEQVMKLPEEDHCIINYIDVDGNDTTPEQ